MYALQRPVREDVRVYKMFYAQRLQLLSQLDCSHFCCSVPAVHGDLPTPGIYPGHHTVTEFLDGGLNKITVFDQRRSQDCPCHTQIQHLFQRGKSPDAAAKLNRDPYCVNDLANGFEILRHPRSCSVQIHQMQKLSSVTLPFLCHPVWLCRIDLLFVEFTLV